MYWLLNDCNSFCKVLKHKLCETKIANQTQITTSLKTMTGDIRIHMYIIFCNIMLTYIPACRIFVWLNTSFQSPLIRIRLMQLETPNDQIISTVKTFQYKHGGPLRLYPLISASKTLLAGTYSSILTAWPSQDNCWILINECLITSKLLRKTKDPT